MAREEARWAYIFIAPTIAGFLVFTLGALAYSLYLSFSGADLMNPPKWVGLYNYRMTWNDPIFWKALANVGIYTVIAVPFGILSSFFLAMLMNVKVKGITWFRTIYYSPSVASVVVTAMIWISILHPRFGMLNKLLGYAHIPPVDWLSTTWIMPSIALIAIWSGVGSNMIIYLAGLKGISSSLYEAASLDGANAVQQFIHITVPMMTPTLFFTLTMGLISALQMFSTPFILTKGSGGPEFASTTPVFMIYNAGFKYFELGHASAMAWMLFVIIMVITALNLGSSRRWVFYEGGRAR